MKLDWVSEREQGKIGLQLYTVRDLLKSDFDTTLKRVAALGYRGGVCRHSRQRHPAPGSHCAIPASRLRQSEEQSRQSFEIAHLLGSQFVVSPWLDSSVRHVANDWNRICDDLNMIGELALNSDLTLAYHNHDFEFADLPGGIRPYDILRSRTESRFVKFELDVYWATKGNLDPARILRENPSRFPLVHLKDMPEDGSTAELGHGSINFASILEAASLSGVEHAFVEQDVSADPLQSIQTSISFLRGQLYFSSGSIRPRAH